MEDGPSILRRPASAGPRRRPWGSELSAVSEPRGAVYYGWWVLLAGAITEMLAIGSTSYAAGLFVLPLEREMSLSRAAASSALPIVFGGAVIMAPLVGYLLDRFAAKWIVTIGAICLGLGFLTIAATSSIPVMVFALLVPVAFGAMAIGPLTTSTLASRWFYRRRGRALGIAAVATSGGGLVVAPLLSMAIESFGWRTALALEALFIITTISAFALLLIRSGPGDDAWTHLENAGRPKTDMIHANSGAKGTGIAPWRYSEIFSSRNFWAIALVLAAITGIGQALVVTLVPYGSELGFAPASIAFFIGGLSVSAATAKIASGLLADIIDRHLIMLAGAFSMIAALLILVLSDSYAALLTMSCLAGIAIGCALPSSAALVAGCFGSPSFGRVMGAVYVAVVLSSIVSVRFAGAVFDRTGNYRAAFMTFLVLAAVAAIATQLIRERNHELQA